MDSLPGQHCDKNDCHQLDFLPFKCDKCSKTFCLAHKGYTDHDCSFDITQASVMPQCPVCTQYIKVPQGLSADIVVNRHINSGCNSDLLEKSEKEKKKIRKNKQCGVCRNPENYDTMICATCRKQFCLTHRHSDSHKCVPPNSSTRASKGGTTVASRLLSMFGMGGSSTRHETKSEEPPSKKAVSNQNSASAQAANRLQMKMKAIGNENIKEENRIYFEVIFPTTDIFGKPLAMPVRNIWFDKNWTIGRVIDDICDRSSLENRNNEKNAKKLNLFSKRNQAQFPYDIPIELLAPELSSGDSVLIAYV